MDARIFLIFEKNKTLHVQLGGHFNNLEMQNQFNEVVEFLEAKKLVHVIFDITKLEVLLNLSQVWLNKFWYPEAVNAGLNSIAFVVPIGFMSHEDIAGIHEKSINQTVKFGFFENIEEAEKWTEAID